MFFRTYLDIFAFRLRVVVANFGDLSQRTQARARKSPSARKRVSKDKIMDKIIDFTRSLICLFIFFFRTFRFFTLFNDTVYVF